MLKLTGNRYLKELKPKPTALEVLLLDELRHIFFILKNRMITPRNYMQFMGEIRAVISKAERVIE